MPVLEGLVGGGSYKQEDLDSYVVHDLGWLGPAALAAAANRAGVEERGGAQGRQRRPWRGMATTRRLKSWREGQLKGGRECHRL